MWIRSLECRNFRNYEYVKLEPDPANPVHIVTKWGVGYYFNEG